MANFNQSLIWHHLYNIRIYLYVYPFICIKLKKRNFEIIHALYIVLIFIFIYKKIYQAVPAFSYELLFLTMIICYNKTLIPRGYKIFKKAHIKNFCYSWFELSPTWYNKLKWEMACLQEIWNVSNLLNKY